MNNLVIVMAGDGSVHEGYARNREFELWVCYWGESDVVAERYAQSCDRLFRFKGQKWALARSVGQVAGEKRPGTFSSYDYVFLLDDDIEFAGGASSVKRTLELAQAVGADIFQPAIANEHSSPGWGATLRIPDTVCHATTIVEIMMPGFSGEIFERCVLPLLHVNGHVTTGWGIEPLVARFAEYVLGRPVRTFVIDEVPAIHTRPVGQGTSTYDVGADEAFLYPISIGTRMKELRRFRSIGDAAQFNFPSMDSVVDWPAVNKHMLRVRGSRRIHELARQKGPQKVMRRMLQKLAARYFPD